MRIAMVSEHASPLAALGGVDAGGQNVHVAALARALGRRGHQVDVYTRRDGAELPERVSLGDGASVVHVPAGPPRPMPKDQLYPLMPRFGRWMAQDWARRGRPDVVHAHFWMSGLAALQATAGTAVPVAQTFHALGTVKRRHLGAADTSPPQRLDCERHLAGHADLVIATCTDELRELARMEAPAERLTVVPCGVDTDHFTPGHTGRSGRPPRLLAVGRLVERKGFDTAVRALAQLPGVELVVAGGPPGEELDGDPEARRLLELARELGVDGRVRLVGQVPHAQMPALYRSADVVLSIPWYEPFGITPLEAAACGVPVVGSAVGGLLDTVEDGVTGRLVPPRDPAAVAGAVAGLLGNAEVAARWGKAGRHRAVDRYDWSAVAAATEEQLRRVVRGPAAAPPPAQPVTSSPDLTSVWLDEHTAQLEEGMRALAGRSELVESWGRRLATVLSGGGRLLAVGNGGSAAEAQHLTGEIVGRFLQDRRPFSAVALCAESASLTAILNDYGVEEVFARQVEAHGRPGDILVVLSTSGRSPNVLAAAKRAHDVGLTVWALTGPEPNPLAGTADEVLAVPAGSTAAVQEVHLVAVHALCAAMDRALLTQVQA
jgi:glycosyltransferase involved in cell wall biosynthesis/phosphoheptose isomerase